MQGLNAVQLPWIEAGYGIFAKEGPSGLKIERLSRLVAKSKSSFYHHFADMEVFNSFLLVYHLEQSELIAEKEMRCADMEELIAVIVEHKIDILFNRRLRIHREVREYEDCFNRTSEIIAGAIAGVWAPFLGLEDNSYLAALVLKLSMENFFLQITEQTLETEWLRQYFHELRHTIQAFRSAPQFLPTDPGLS